MAKRKPQSNAIPPLPARPADGHKGTFGTVIVLGGSVTMIGAPALCATAAFRGGAGLVKIAAPLALLPFILTIEPGATGVDITRGSLDRALDSVDPEHRAVLAVGPGLGRSRRAAALVRAALRGDRRIVLDADALNLLAQSGDRIAKLRPRAAAPVILTPHPGEFARLAKPMKIAHSPTDPAKRPLAAAALAKAHGCVVVLKGQHTIIADSTRTVVNQTGNPALATAGSGDILTGVIASLLAQGMRPFEAAQLGAHLHGLAADLWASARGNAGMTARDLATMLPDAMQRSPRLPRIHHPA